MTAADTPPLLLVGGPEGERELLKGYLLRNKLSCVASVATLAEAAPHLTSHPQCTLVLVRPADPVQTGAWVVERKGQGFQGRVGVIVALPDIKAYVAKGRWNDFALKIPVAEPDFLGAARSASRMAERV